jgi:tetratricopeptide (TPR) repeat protein
MLSLLLVLPAVWAQAQDSTTRMSSEYSVEELVTQGNFYLARGDFLLAQRVFQLALEREPDNVEALLGKGRALISQGQLDLGIRDYQRAIEVAPDNMAAYVRLAQAYRAQYFTDRLTYAERPAQALEVLQRAERINNQYADLYNMRGVILYSPLQRLEEAKVAFERAIALNSNVAQYHTNLGAVYRSLGQLELALTSFRRALMLKPDDAEARNELGSLYFVLGRCDDAIFELQQAVSLNPRLLQANFNLGRALFDCGQVEASAEHFRRAIEIDPVSLPPAYTYLARVYLNQGRYAQAVTEAQKGALLPPENAEAFYWLGQAYEARNNSNDLAAARQAYQQALEIDPNFTPAREALGRLP